MPDNFLESNEDIIRVVGWIYEKSTLICFKYAVWVMFGCKFDVWFCKQKKLLKILLIALQSAMVFLLKPIKWETADYVFLFEIMVLVPFQVFLALFLLLPKYLA